MYTIYYCIHIIVYIQLHIVFFSLLEREILLMSIELDLVTGLGNQVKQG